MVIAGLPAAAQWRHFGTRPEQVSGFFGIGFSEAANPLARRLDAGWNFAGGVGVTGDYFGIMADAMFTRFGINDAALAPSGFRTGHQSYWAITADPIIHINQRGPVDFYITGGAGLYTQTTSYRGQFGLAGPYYGRGDLTSSDTIFKPGVNGGAGFSFGAGYYTRIRIFAEARFHHMFTRDPGASFIPVTIGVRF
jgi:hypothetical protein